MASSSSAVASAPKSTPTRTAVAFSPEEQKELKQTFSWYDNDNDDCVLLKELPTVVHLTTGKKWTQDYILQLIQEHDPQLLDKFTELSKQKNEAKKLTNAASSPATTTVSPTNTVASPTTAKPEKEDKDTSFAKLPVPFQTYLKILSSRLISEKDDDFLLSEAFKRFDVNDSDSVAPAELRLFFKTMLGENLAPEEAMKMVDDVDLDHDGVINFEEFKELAKKLKIME